MRKTWRLLAAVALSAGIVAAPAYAVPTIPAPDKVGYDVAFNPDEEPVFEVQKLATGGEGGYECYRIPSLGVDVNGKLHATWDGRPYNCADAPQANSIVGRESTDNGATWNDQHAIAPGNTGAGKFGYSDPSIVVDWHTGTVFNFHVKSFDAGIGGSQVGTDPNQRNVIHAAYAKSTDGGENWSYDHVITDQITRHPTWKGRFATSGNGVQLQYGRWAGRLLQPAMIITTDGRWRNVAWISDDHGETWYSSTPYGDGMDENKIIELSDGTLMNNSRDSRRGGYRKVSYSYDGGITWTEPVQDRNLPDPANNASLIRAFPNAPQGSAKAKVLLFSNTAGPGRSNGTLRLSCDDGKTWPVAKMFREQSIQYTSMATLPNGRVGMLFEDNGSNISIYFAQFNLNYIGGACAGVEGDKVVAESEQQTTATVTVDNFLGDDIVDSRPEISAPFGWDVEVDPVSVASGAKGELTLRVTPHQAFNAGTYPVNLRFQSVTGPVSVTVPVVIEHDRDAAPEDVTVRVTVLNPKASYQVGDQIRYSFEITNPLDYAVGVYPNGDLENFDPDTARRNCRWQNFPAKSTQSCNLAYHVVTEEDIERGSFDTQTTWTVAKPFQPAQVLAVKEVPVPTVAASEDPVQEQQFHFDLTVDPVAPAQAAEVQLTARVTGREDEATLADDAKIAFYVDGTKVGEAPVESGVATLPYTPAKVAAGDDQVTHKVVARLVMSERPQITVLSADARGTITVVPEDRPEVDAELTLNEFNDIVSDGNARRVVVVAQVTDAVGEEVEFFLGEDSVGTAVVNAQGKAVIDFEVPSIPRGGEAKQWTVAAALAEQDTPQQLRRATRVEQSFRVHPVPEPEQVTETTTATSTLTSTETATETSTQTVTSKVTTVETTVETTEVTTEVTVVEPTTELRTTVSEVTVTATEPTTVTTEVTVAEPTTITKVESTTATTVATQVSEITVTATEPTTVTTSVTVAEPTTVLRTEVSPVTTTAEVTTEVTVVEPTTVTTEVPVSVPTTVTATETVVSTQAPATVTETATQTATTTKTATVTAQPTAEPAAEGSSTFGIVAAILGLLAALGVLGAVTNPAVMQFVSTLR